MPLTRYQIRSEHSLADPELYRTADKDDPEALLEGVAMAGLVGVLRQLGDLAEFAAEIFHDLHEEVVATAARGHGLMVRVQQLEAEFPSLERAFLSQTDHSVFFHSRGTDWHPNLHVDQNLVTKGDLPRFVMDSYEECRGPPRLFLLDKFDVAGAGACLKRYTDPSIFKVETPSPGVKKFEMQREKKIRKVKKKGSRWRNGGTPEVVPTSHGKLHQLLLEERVQNGSSVPVHNIKLKRRQFNGSTADSKSGKSYMERFSMSPSAQQKGIHQVSISTPLETTTSNNYDLMQEVVEISTVSPTKKELPRKKITAATPNSQEVDLKPPIKVPESGGEVNKYPFNAEEVVEKKDFAAVEFSRKELSFDDSHSDDVISEIENYVDALPTMESELDTDSDYRFKHNNSFMNVEKHGTDSDANEEPYDLQPQFSDSLSVGNFSTSDDSNNSFKRGKNNHLYADTLTTLAEDVHPDGYGATEVFPAIDCAAEIICTSSDRLPMSEKLSGMNSCELPLSYKSEQGEASCTSCITESNGTLLSLKPGATSEEVSSDYSEPRTRASNANEYDKILGDHLHIASHFSAVPFETEIYSAKELANVDVPDNFPDVILQKSNVSDLPLVNKSKDNIVSEVCPAEHVNDSSTPLPQASNDNILSEVCHAEHANDSSTALNLVNGTQASNDNIVSEVCQAEHANDSSMALNLVNGTQTITSLEEEQHQALPMPGLDTHLKHDLELPDNLSSTTCNPVFVEPGLMVSEVDTASLAGVNPANLTVLGNDIDDSLAGGLDPENEGTVKDSEVDSISTSKLYSENLVTLTDSRATSTISALHISEVKDDVFPPDPDTSEADVQLAGTLADYELNATSLVDGLNGSSDCQGEGSIKDYVQVAATANEANDIVAMASVSASVAASDSNGAENYVSGNICPPSDINYLPFKKPSNGGDDFPSFGNSSEMKLGTDNTMSLPDAHSEIQKEGKQLAAVPADGSFISYSEPQDESNTELIDSAADLLLVEKVEGLSLKQADHDLESFPTKSENHLVETELIDSAPGLSLAEEVEGLSLKESDRDLESFPTKTENHLVEDSESSRYLAIDQNSEPRTPGDNLKLPVDPSKLETSGKGRDPLESSLPDFLHLSKAEQVQLEETPPMPPLPPMQWRIGKFQAIPNPLETKTTNNCVDGYSQFLSSKMANENAHFGFPSLGGGAVEPQMPKLALSAAQEEENEEIVSENLLKKLVQPSQLALHMPVNDYIDDSKRDFHTLEESQLLDPNLESSPSDEPHLASKGERVQNTNISQTVPPPAGTTPSSCPTSLEGKPVHQLNQIEVESIFEGKKHQQTFQSSDRDWVKPPETSVSLPTAEVARREDHQHGFQTMDVESVSSSSSSHILSLSEHALQSVDVETMLSSSASALPPSMGDENLDGKPSVKIPRPRDPLIEAVAAHDKSQLKKVTERVRPQIKHKADNRDSLLEQIRAKSFNLKPAPMVRPSIQGPHTNLNVAAILEKANAIRQALAGSDEDDDADTWSDS